MSVHWMARVLDAPLPTSAADRLMMVVLADVANAEGVSWYSVPKLARKAAVTTRSAQRTLARLEADGLIERQERSGTSTVTRLLPGLLEPGLFDGGGVDARGDVDARGVGAVRPDAGATTPTTRASPTPSMNHQVDEGVKLTPFEKFWQAWPVKVKKKQSKALWKKRGMDHLADRLIADVAHRLEADDRWRRGYIPDCPVYLRNDRWEDDFTQPRKGANGDTRIITNSTGFQMKFDTGKVFGHQEAMDVWAGRSTPFCDTAAEPKHGAMFRQYMDGSTPRYTLNP